MNVVPQTSLPPPNRKETPAAGGLSTKVNVTAPPVATAQALTSSARATPFRKTGIGRPGHRTVRPSLALALSCTRRSWALPEGPLLLLLWQPAPPIRKAISRMARATMILRVGDPPVTTQPRSLGSHASPSCSGSPESFARRTGPYLGSGEEHRPGRPNLPGGYGDGRVSLRSAGRAARTRGARLRRGYRGVREYDLDGRQRGDEINHARQTASIPRGPELSERALVVVEGGPGRAVLVKRRRPHGQDVA